MTDINNTDKPEEKIEDAEIVADAATSDINKDENEEETDEENTESVESADSETGENAAVSQINLESLINRYIKDIDATKEKMKMQKTMLEDAFNNDAGYAEAQQKVKEVTKVRNGIRQKIQKQPGVMNVMNEINGLKEEIKDQQEGLSQYLQQYQLQSGNSSFTGEGGEVLEIVTSRRLVRKNSKYRP